MSFLSKLFRRKKAPPPEAAESEDVADEPEASETKRRRFRIPLPRLPAIPRPSGPAVGTLVVVAGLTGLGAWLALHGD